MKKGLFIPHFLEEMFTFLETFPKMDTFLKCPQCARLIVGVQTRLEKIHVTINMSRATGGLC